MSLTSCGSSNVIWCTSCSHSSCRRHCCTSFRIPCVIPAHGTGRKSGHSYSKYSHRVPYKTVNNSRKILKKQSLPWQTRGSGPNFQVADKASLHHFLQLTLSTHQSIRHIRDGSDKALLVAHLLPALMPNKTH